MIGADARYAYQPVGTDHQGYSVCISENPSTALGKEALRPLDRRAGSPFFASMSNSLVWESGRWQRQCGEDRDSNKQHECVHDGIGGDSKGRECQ